MELKYKRIIAGVIDFGIACYAGVFVVQIVSLGKVPVSLFTVILYLVSTFSFLIFKDLLFKNASVGKKIFNISIVKNNGTKLKVTDVIKRNITIVFLVPIEVCLLMTDNVRLGEKWSQTSIHSA